MQIPEKLRPKKGSLVTIFVFTFMSVSFLVYGAILYLVVGTRPGPTWFFGTMPDVPGQSEYSTSSTKQFFLNATSPEKGGVVSRQHVMGEENDPTFRDEWKIDETRDGR